MVYWSEPATNDSVVTKLRQVLPNEVLPKPLPKDLPPEFTLDRKHGSVIYSKVRRFVVVRQGQFSSQCV